MPVWALTETQVGIYPETTIELYRQEISKNFQKHPSSLFGADTDIVEDCELHKLKTLTCFKFFTKMWWPQNMVSVLNLDYQKYCLHQTFLYLLWGLLVVCLSLIFIQNCVQKCLYCPSSCAWFIQRQNIENTWQLSKYEMSKSSWT